VGTLVCLVRKLLRSLAIDVLADAVRATTVNLYPQLSAIRYRTGLVFL
jgi:hypothetical protein